MLLIWSLFYLIVIIKNVKVFISNPIRNSSLSLITVFIEIIIPDIFEFSRQKLYIFIGIKFFRLICIKLFNFPAEKFYYKSILFSNSIWIFAPKISFFRWFISIFNLFKFPAKNFPSNKHNISFEFSYQNCYWNIHRLWSE